MRSRFAGLAALLGMSMAAPAGAAQVDVTSVVGIWTSADTAVTGLNTSAVEWGTAATGSGRSGYVFSGAAPPNLGPLSPNVSVVVGDFTHNNFPIIVDATIPTQVELVVTVQGTISEGAQSTSFTLFDTLNFGHLETTNNANPCAAGGVSPCPDQVTLTQVNVPDVTIDFLGVTYGFNVNGFLNGSNQVVNQILTLENAVNTVNIQGVFTATAVPLPAGHWFLIAALGAFAYVSRRSI